MSSFLSSVPGDGWSMPCTPRPGVGAWRLFRGLTGLAAALVIGLGVGSPSAQGYDPLRRADDSRARFSGDNIWTLDSASAVAAPGRDSRVAPTGSTAVSLNPTELRTLLAQAPAESADVSVEARPVMALPMPDGTFRRFLIVESPIMAPELAARYPNIKTYAGQGVDDPTATVRFDFTPLGFHAQVLSPNGIVYVNPRWHGDVTHYASHRREGASGSGAPFSCQAESEPDVPYTSTIAGTSITSGPTLRTYRLAVAAAGEFTQYHGGTVEAGMAAIVTITNQVIAIFETEVAVRMVLVPDNDLLVYTDPASDPYDPAAADPCTYNTVANQSTCDTVIGSANYDMGHVLLTVPAPGGGCASIGSVCRVDTKARGGSALPLPGLEEWVGLVAHEMGHQFGARHTFNGVAGFCSPNSRASQTAYEPGSGSTIMSYAGDCETDNVVPYWDHNFHSNSFDEVRNYIVSGAGAACPIITATGNDPPAVDAGPSHAIPHSTPFVLTATGSDPNDDAISYSWEERDLGPAAPLDAPDDGQIPLFRVRVPTASPSRYFPALESLLSNMPSNSEKLPTRGRPMWFRVTARDNRGDGGGVAWDDVVLQVAGTGPFAINQPFSSTEIIANAPLDVTWSVAGTDASPVGTSEVNILLSTDGGSTFPFLLAANTPNDGGETVAVPDVPTADARIMVEAVGNVFFAISGTCPLQMGEVDENGNGRPDRCDPAPPLSAGPPDQNRSLGLSLDAATTAEPGPTRTLRVTMVDLQSPIPANLAQFPPPDFSSFELGSCGDPGGCARWVGPPQPFLESNDVPARGSFRAARLQCTPYYQDWSVEGPVHIVGAEVVPSSTYEVHAFAAGCAGMEATCIDYSPPLVLTTSRAGDVASPFQDPSQPLSQPNALDITALVNKFRSLIGAPTKAAAQLQPNVTEPGLDTNALDITAAVNYFRYRPYAYSGPCVCPSTVVCGANACVSASDCPGGAAAATCVRTCDGGPHDGRPCTSNKNCGLCTAGTYLGYPCATGADCGTGGACDTASCSASGSCRDLCGRCD